MPSQSKRQYLGASPQAGGFTLVEVIVVIGLLGLIAAVVIPSLGQIDSSKRMQMTGENLENIRTAILGPRDAFDEDGQRVAGGYVGDMGHLPVLYVCDWDPSANHWQWGTEKYTHSAGDTRPGGHPRGLWESQWQRQYGSGPSEVDLGSRWNGPYTAAPKDQYPRDAEQFDWNQADDRDEIRMRATDGKFSDGWGRALLFWRDDNSTTSNPSDDTLWIVSEGPDRKSTWESDGSYDETRQDNLDNIVLKITPNEWYCQNVEEKVTKTRCLLEQVQQAITGPAAYDGEGKTVIGGYAGDIGSWPELYKWDSSKWDLVETTSPSLAELCDEDNAYSLRGLWRQKPDDDEGQLSSYASGLGWRCAYMAKPWDCDEKEVIRDTWDRPLIWIYCNALTSWDGDLTSRVTPVLPNAATPASTLIILSAGADGRVSYDFTTPTSAEARKSDEDNVYLMLFRTQWAGGAFSLANLVVSNATQDATNGTKTLLFTAYPNTSIIKKSTDGTWNGQTWTVSLNSADTQAGRRYLIVWNDNGAGANSGNDLPDDDEQQRIIFYPTVRPGGGSTSLEARLQ